MDPLSEVLALLKPRSSMAGGLDLGGEWCVQFARHEGIKCYALVSGQCWLAVEGVPEPVRLETGDCFLLPRGLSFRLATDLSLPPMTPEAMWAIPLHGHIVTWNGGGGCLAVGGFFALSGTNARFLLEQLPPIVHIRGESDRAELRWALDRMRQEIREQRPGASLVAQQLSTMLLVQALRLHLEDGLKDRTGWLAALADRQLNVAMTAMHSDSGHPWTLQKLAETCGMSRSIFAQRFKKIVGTSPLDYLTRWRMMLAQERLRESDDSISIIAGSLGYDSESAFSKAFKRIAGCGPRQFRRGKGNSAATE